jgi:hypothetical protein
MTPDPWGFVDGPNLYCYCHNNPLSLIDWIGLASEEFGRKGEGLFRDPPMKVPPKKLPPGGGGRPGPRFDDGRPPNPILRYFEDEPRVKKPKTERPKLHLPQRTWVVSRNILCGTSHGAVNFGLDTVHFIEMITAYGLGYTAFLLSGPQRFVNGIKQRQAIQREIVDEWATGFFKPDDPIYYDCRIGAERVLGISSAVVPVVGMAQKARSLSVVTVDVTNFVRRPFRVRQVSRTVGRNSEYDKIVSEIEQFLGPESRAFQNGSRDLIIESSDGMRQFRIDLNHPHPHANPHSHVIEYDVRKGKKKRGVDRRIYPIDVKAD